MNIYGVLHFIMMMFKLLEILLIWRDKLMNYSLKYFNISLITLLELINLLIKLNLPSEMYSSKKHMSSF